jgi:predicted metalloprotease with PDZ domain
LRGGVVTIEGTVIFPLTNIFCRRLRGATFTVILLVASLLASGGSLLAAPTITYTLAMSRPSTHLFEVELRVEGLSGADSALDFQLPAWRTGRYVIFDFAGGVERFSAADGGGNPLAWRKTDKSTWHVSPAGSEVVVRYLVYANESSQRTRGLDDEHGFVDATGVLMMVVQYRTAPLTLAVRPYGEWHVTTGLEPAGGRSTFSAAGYDELADCPMEIGVQRDVEFTVRGVPHVFSVAGRTNCLVDSTVAWTKRIVEANAAFWGGLPYKRYVFLLRFTPDAGGGTEHRNSCVLDMPSTVYRTPEPCRQLIGLVAHEFFHTWNVKRLRPKGMNPYDFTKESYYRELWLAEGGTSYMENVLQVRSGMKGALAYVRELPGRIAADRQRPGNLEQSVAECSFDVWVKYMHPSPRAWNFETDLYDRGASVSLLLDLELRHRSGNAGSFDELLRLLWRRFPSGSAGYTLEDVEQAAVDLAGEGMRGCFARWVYGAGPLPWEAELGYAGLELIAVKGSQGAWMGISAAPDESGGATVRRVVAGSPADAAGMDTGDQLLALDGLRLRGDDLARRIADYKPGDRVRLTYFHHDELREREIALAANPVPEYTVIRAERPDSLQQQIYESWLGHRWDEHE